MDFYKRGRYLYKTLLSYFCVILIPMLVIGPIYLLNSSKKIKNDFINRSITEMKHLSSEVETVLNSIEATTVQQSLNPLLNKLLNDPNSGTAYEYRTVKEDLRNYSILDPLIHSIYVHFKLNNTVITTGEGIYKLNDFYDKNFIDEILANESRYEWWGARKLTTGMENQEGINVITFSRDLPVTRTYSLGSLVINMREDVFLNVLNRINNNRANDVFIINSKGNIIFHRDKEYLGKPLADLGFDNNALQKTEGVKNIILDNRKYYAVYMKTAYNDWLYVRMLTLETLNRQLREERNVVIIVFMLVFILGLIPSYFFAVKMSSTWKNLLVKMGVYLQNMGRDIQEQDEYRAVSTAIDSLIADNQETRAVIEESKPVIKERLIYDLLFNNIYNHIEIKEKLKYAGIHFKYDKFLALTVSISGLEETDNIQSRGNSRVYIRSLLERKFSGEFQAVGILFEEDKIALVISLDCESLDFELQRKLKESCLQVNHDIYWQINLSAIFSFGFLCNDILKVGDSFTQARKKLNYKAVIGEGEVLFCHSQENSLFYPVSLQKQIINGIKSYDEVIVDSVLNRLFDEYVFNRKYSQEEVQQMLMVLVGAVIGELWHDGIILEQHTRMEVIGSISNCSSSKSLQQLIQSYFSSIVKQQQNENNNITKAICFMETNFNRDISVNDIAEHVGLSHIYLSRIFKLFTGRTMVEYLTVWRIKKAKEMFECKEKSLQEISACIGYNDVHSFIRYFKKYEGVTPGEYRAVNSKK